MRRKLSLFLSLLTGLLFAVTPARADKIFLLLEGTPGTSTATGHVGEIELTSVQFGVESPAKFVTNAAGQATPPRGEPKTLIVEKVVDAVSPLLFIGGLVGGGARARITFQDELTGRDYMLLDFEQLTLVKNESLLDEGSRETLSFGFIRMTLTYIPVTGNQVRGTVESISASF